MFRKMIKPTLIVIAMGSMSAFAGDPVNLNITGRVIASPCNVLNGGSGDMAIDLGQDISATDLIAAGSGSTPVTKDLKLEDCPAGTNNVKVTFSGTADGPNPTMYANADAAPGGATPVAVELSNAETSAVLQNGSSITKAVESDKTVTYKLKARAYTAAGGVTPGTITAVVVADFTYQ